jgi:hypothetical protein
VRVAGGAMRIAVDPAGKPWVVNSSHKVYSYGPVPRASVTCTDTSPDNNNSTGCGPYKYAAINASTGQNTYVTNDGWNNQSGERYDLQVVDPGNWTDSVTAQPCQCVSAYPSVEQFFDNYDKVTSFTQITSTYSENMNANSRSVTHASFDIWTGPTSNVWADETMVMNDWTGGVSGGMQDPGCGSTILASPTFTEPSTGKHVTYDFCQSGSERTFVRHGEERTGSADILAMLKWEQANGYLPATDLLGEVDYGWEILSTGGQPQPLALSGYSLTTTPDPG